MVSIRSAVRLAVLQESDNWRQHRPQSLFFPSANPDSKGSRIMNYHTVKSMLGSKPVARLTSSN